MIKFFCTCAMYSIRYEIRQLFEAVRAGDFFRHAKQGVMEVFNYLKAKFPELVKFVRKLLPPDFCFNKLFESPRAFFNSIAGIPRYWFEFFNQEFQPAVTLIPIPVHA